MRKFALILIVCFVLSFSANAQNNAVDNTSQNQSAEVAEIEKINSELKRLFRAGKYSEALKLAEQELALRIKLYGAEGKDVAVSYSNIGTIYRLKNKQKEAIKAIQQSLEILEKNNMEESLQASVCMSEIGLLHSLSDNNTAAEEWLTKAIKTAEKADKNYSVELYTCVFYAARFYRGIKQFEKANDLFIRAIEIANIVYGRKSDVNQSLWFEYECFASHSGLIINMAKIEELRAKHNEPNDEPKTVNGGVLNGRAISLAPPAYPAGARNMRTSVTVEVRILTNEEGKVIRACLVSGPILFQDVTLAAARASKFSPTLLEGKPVRVTGTIKYTFIPR